MGIKINLSGTRVSEDLNALVNIGILRMNHETLEQMNVASVGQKATRGQEFSHLATHSITLHFINKAPGHNSHIFTML